GQWTTQKSTSTGSAAITYACKTCRGVSIRAEHIERWLYETVAERLVRSDAVDLLKAEIHDAAEAEAIRIQLETLYRELEKIGVERGEQVLTGRQAKIASDIVAGKIAKLEQRQQDQEKPRVFEDIPLGTPEAASAIKNASPDRFRAIVNVLMAPTVSPIGKGGHIVDPDTGKRGIDTGRVKPHWR